MDTPMLLSREFEQGYPGDSLCKQINRDIPDASKIVSVVHERNELGRMVATVYYLG